MPADLSAMPRSDQILSMSKCQNAPGIQPTATARTSEERLEVHSSDPPGRTVPNDQPSDVDDTDPLNKQLQLAIRDTIIVQPNALRNSCASTRLPSERSTTNRLSVNGIAGGEWRDGANDLVFGIIRWKICV